MTGVRSASAWPPVTFSSIRNKNKALRASGGRPWGRGWEPRACHGDRTGWPPSSLPYVSSSPGGALGVWDTPCVPWLRQSKGRCRVWAVVLGHGGRVTQRLSLQQRDLMPAPLTGSEVILGPAGLRPTASPVLCGTGPRGQAQEDAYPRQPGRHVHRGLCAGCDWPLHHPDQVRWRRDPLLPVSCPGCAHRRCQQVHSDR